jgi:hypothetical protein
LAFRVERRLTIESMMSVVSIDSFACGNLRGRRVETTLTVWAKNAPMAASRAIERVNRRVRCRLIFVSVMTICEANWLL